MTDKPRKIILVEHNPRYGRLIQGMVKEITEPQFELLQVQSITEAIKQFNKDEFDVALLDLNLPDSQGLDTLTAVQSHVPNVPIVVVTGAYDRTMALRAVQEGAQDYLVVEQIDGNVLERVIRYAIERKKGYEGLREVTQIFNGILSSVPIALLGTDEKGICTQSVGSAFRRWGLEDNQLVGMSVFETYPGATEEMRKALQGGEVQFVEKQMFKDKPIYFQNHFFHDKVTGKGLVGISIEITDLKLAEEELRKQRDHLEDIVKERTKELRNAQEELVRKEKLATLGQLAGGVGHELRSPLGAIKNAAYFLNMALEPTEPEVKETLEILEKEVNASERIIRSLLDFARPKPLERQKVDIHRIIETALSRTAMPRSVKVVKQLDRTVSTIMCDPGQLSQVFGNIIINAIQAMPEGGQIAVKTKASDSEWIVISFADTGAGVPVEHLEKLFEPLFTTKTKGIGLGMAVAKILVEAHGGTIKVESKVGEGSIISVRLPIGQES